MAIAGLKPSVQPKSTPEPLEVAVDHYKGVVYDDQRTPLHNLLAHVSGSPWTLSGYYRQKLGLHNDLRELDTQESEVYQQYIKIHHMEIRVSSALSSSFNSETGITSVTGSAIVYPFTIPNRNDYFKAKTIDHQEAMFKVTSVERRTVNRDSYYQIEYELVTYLSQDPELFNDLDIKVVEEYYFNKDRLLENLNPLLTSEQQHLLIENRVSYAELVKYYFRSFFNRGYAALLVPSHSEPTYDHFLTKYLLSVISTEEAPEVGHIRVLANDHNPYLEGYQFWDALYNRDINLLKVGNKQMSLVSTKQFSNNPWMSGVRFGLVKYIVFPKDPDSSHLGGKLPKVVAESILGLSQAPNALGDEPDYSEQFPLVTSDEYYVLSEEFYNEAKELSLLEKLTLDYLHDRVLDVKQLNSLCSNVYSWGRLEQFYYLPIVFTLLKQSQRERY